MKLSDLIQINTELTKVLNAYHKHHKHHNGEQWDSIAKPLAQIIGKTDALIWIHSHNIELEVK